MASNRKKPAAAGVAPPDRRARMQGGLTRRSPSKPPPSGTERVDRKQFEEALTASEVRYRRLFETAKDGILILDADTGAIADVNPFLEQLLGYTHTELCGKRLWEIGPFRDIAANKTAFQRLQRNEYIRYENLPLESKAGQSRNVEFVSNLYMVDHTKVIQCNIRDITERKRAEEIVRSANAELSALVKTLQTRDAQMTLINRMNDLLQSCRAQEEAYQVVAMTAGELFAGQSGALAILHASGHYLETVAQWGDDPLVETVFALEDCWAMRRGRPHEVAEPLANPVCNHFARPPETGCLCLPLTVQGETLGLFCLTAPSAKEGETPFRADTLAVTVGEAIKLSLSNLRLRDKLREQATHDTLTGLFNRRYLEDSLPRELHRAVRHSVPLCVAMLDLDHFKKFNDTFGHDAGDLLLREVGRVLRENVRKSDIACRYGGEEFVLVLPESTLTDTEHRLEQIRLVLQKLQVRHGDELLGAITVSAGVAEAPANGTTSDRLLRAADLALYAAKQAGRNCIVLCPGTP